MSSGEIVTLSRDCPVVLIPSGEREMLRKGAQVSIVQVLGGSYTVQTRTGLLARIEGKDAEALGLESVPQAAKPSSGSLARYVDEKHVWEELKTCFDPEIPVNIVDLGLIYECHITNLPESGSRIDIQLTLTAPGCGMGQVLKEDIEGKLTSLEGVKQANVDLVFDPPWDQSRMSEAAKLQLGML